MRRRWAEAHHRSASAKTAQGVAMPRNACSPSGISGCRRFRRECAETSTVRPSGLHSPSSRLTRLTAGPIAVKSSRSAVPILPHSISPRCSAVPNGKGGRPCPRACPVEMIHAGACRNDRAQRGIAGVGRVALADREDRQYAVADEFQHLAAEGVNGAGDAVEPGVECSDHLLRLGRLRQLREAAQIGIEQGRPDGLAGLAPQPAGQHLRGAAPAEIGLEQCRQGRARRKRGERRGGKARDLAAAARIRPR